MEMEGGNGSSSERGRRWKNLSYDLLTHIFSFLCMADIVSNAALVCKSWHAATTDPILWKTLDLDVYFHKFNRRTVIYNLWSNKFQYPGRFEFFFASVMKYNRGDITKLLLAMGTFLKDAELIHMAVRSPSLKFLYIPVCPMITEEGLLHALRLWSNLESVSISYLFYRRYLMLQFIGESCKNVSSFKFTHEAFDEEIALAMTSYLPGLKIVTLLCYQIENEALEILLDGLKNLEELYISDMVDFHSSRVPEIRLPDMSEKIVRKVSRLQRFHFCRYRHCLKCPTAPGNNKVIKKE